MKRYDFDTVIDRRGSDCEKYGNNAEVFGTDDLLPMWIADMDFASGDFIIDALTERVKHGVYGYGRRCPEFWEAIQGWLQSQNGWEVRREWLEFSPGVVAGVVFAMQSLSNEGDGILIQPPVYHPFARVIEDNGRVVVNNELVQDENGVYQIDFEDFEQKIQEVKAFILCNPHNPTGRVFTREELTRMGEICLKHGVVVISDEIHMDFVFKPLTHLHMAALDERFAQNTITITAPSKSFNIAGLCTAYAVIPNPELMESYQKMMCRIHCDNTNIYGLSALKAAYTKGEQWMVEMRDYLEANIDFAVDFINKNIPSIKCYKPESTFLMWLDFREWGMDCETLKAFLIEKAKLGMNCGGMYGECGKGFVRMNIGVPRVTLEKALNQLLEAASHTGK